MRACARERSFVSLCSVECVTYTDASSLTCVFWNWCTVSLYHSCSSSSPSPSYTIFKSHFGKIASEIIFKCLKLNSTWIMSIYRLLEFCWLLLLFLLLRLPPNTHAHTTKIPKQLCSVEKYWCRAQPSDKPIANICIYSHNYDIANGEKGEAKKN